MRRSARILPLLFLLCSVILGQAQLAWSQESPGDAPAAAAAPPPAEPKPLDRGDNAWMLTSSALVLMMTGPGLAMFYCGLVRKKNVLSVIMQCIFLMGLMTVIWGLYGYSLSFGGSEAWIGNSDYLFMRNVQAEWKDGASVIPQSTAYNIPMLTHMLFQGMFFIITPALICGAFAERMKFSTMVVFMILWGTLVYCPLCHWVWGGGILAYNTEHAKQYAMGGALDFAGGTVVHISSGVSALICALLIGKRLGYGRDPMPPHNLTYTAFGAAMLWVGWFGFNAGSACAADGIAASAFAATHFSAAAAALAWAGMEWIARGKPTVLGACSGAVAGLVCITPASGYVLPMPAMAMGAAAGIVCYLACTTLKSKFGYDDSLDAFGVHGIGGTLGAILTGVFATRAVQNLNNNEPIGMLEGGSLLTGQLVATAITWVFAAAVTVVLLKVLDATMGLRVTPEEETQGLDLTQHGEEGYIFM
ncbi:MAG TPA: ammonium transporter [Pirellulales bacterium]|jgi:Amt family ammonium transporter|nr:ammonium transporter [Pirellulales bacterium]